MRRAIPLVMLVVLLVGSSLLSVSAQDRTPQIEDDGFPMVADPALCIVEPRNSQELLDIWFPETGTPAAVITEEMPSEGTIPVGVPIVPNESVFAGITLTVQEVLACFSAGDFTRALALFTDDLVMSFGPGPGETREDVAGFLETTPVPESGGVQPIELLAITDAMLLEDGRVGAFVVDREVVGEEVVTGTVYVVFELSEGRWLVDELIEFSPGTEE